MAKYKLNISFAITVLLLLQVFVSCKQVAGETSNTAPVQVAEDKISLSESQMQLANIKVIEVKEAEFGYSRIFTGVLKVNEESAVNITSRTFGRVLKLYYKNSGENVHVGDSLYQLYSDELVLAQRDYFTIQSNNWNFNGRFEPSLDLEKKLLLLGMIPSQIKQLKKDGKILFGITICSPVNGVIRSINVTEGQYVTEGQTLFEMADDTKLWVEAQVNPQDIKFLNVGMPCTVTVPVVGNKPIKSKISFINPSLEQDKYVVVVRTNIDNKGKQLHPGMLAHLEVQSDKGSCVAVPSSAVITDKNGSLVWIQNMDGSFSARKVDIGMQSEDMIQILSGLEEYEYVVVSGAYLLNSEQILRRGTLADATS